MDATSDAVRALWEAVAPEHRPASRAALVEVVDEVWRRARAAYPELDVTEVELMTFAGARLHASDPVTALARRHAADLYLACGCARGDASAIAAFEATTAPLVERALHAVTPDRDARRELLQVLREQMLVGSAERAPGISGYDGRAPLVTWLRVCAVRLARRTAERAHRDISLDDTHLDELAPGVPDPALAYMRRHYGAQFRTALGAAIATLSPRERNLLRHAVLDELGIDQLAAIYHVHRSTIARQLKQARATLVAATRAQLRTLLDVGETELESIFRVLVSLTHVTVRDILGPRRP